MPTALVELVREAKYLVVVIRGITTLPEGLYAFSGEGCVKTPEVVGIRLPRDKGGEVDTMPLDVACDWLRDQGWAVEAHPLCPFSEKVLAKHKG